MSDTEPPKLEAPGAGLPAFQEYALRYAAFPIMRRALSTDRALAIFESETRATLRLVRPLTAAARTRRVLVPRMLGIEDSSRYWSLDMTLDHLVIVSRAVLDGVVTLSQGKTIGFKVDTAAVKPQLDTAPDIYTQLEALAARARDHLANHAGDLDTRNCHDHPWFGCLNPHGWLVMLAVHTFIHRRQAVAITRRL